MLSEIPFTTTLSIQNLIHTVQMPFLIPLAAAVGIAIAGPGAAVIGLNLAGFTAAGVTVGEHSS